MKIALSVAAFPTNFGPMMYSGENLTELEVIFRKIKGFGYDGMDLFLNNKTPSECGEIKALLDRYELEVSMAIFIYLFELGVNLSHRDNQVRAKAVKTYIGEIEKAHILGARTVPLGFIRGKRDADDSYDDYCERLAESTRQVSRAALDKGIRLCIEPINRYEVNTMLSVAETLRFLEKYHLDETWLLPDLFHMNIEDAQMGEALQMAGTRIGHLHVPDSNRRMPGLGHIDYQEVMDALNAAGYDGYLSAEAMCGDCVDQEAEDGIQYLRSLMV